MKKTNLALITSIFLFIFVNASLAQAGCVTIKVVYNDGCPRGNADVRTIIAPNDPQVRYICTTGEDGQCSRCNYLEQGDYKIQAWYDIAQFGPDTFLGIDGNGNGSQIITNTVSTYPNGTETCGNSECDGYKYCYTGSPNYVQCDSWNTECDTKKCCTCNGGIQAQPTENYNSSQNGDCPFCQKCNAIDTCGYQSGEDLKNECSSNNIIGIATCDNDPDLIHFTWDFRNPFTSACNGAGSCTTGNSTITHTCNKSSCSAPCEVNSDCKSNICKSDCTCEPPTCGLSTNNIDFSSVETGQISAEQIVTLINTGNSPTTSLTVKGNQWSDGGSNNFAVGQTHWDLTSGQNYETQMTTLTTSDQNLGQQVSPGTPLPVYFKLKIPEGQSKATYIQTITFTGSC